MIDYRGKDVFVFGLGKTGLSIIATLLELGAVIAAWDDNQDNVAEARKLFTKIHYFAPERLPSWKNFHEIFVSPGIPTTGPKEHFVAKSARDNNIKITSDLDLLYKISSCFAIYRYHRH